MAQKISSLESKVKEMDSKTTKSIINKEAPNKDLKEKRTNLKGSEFKFGDEKEILCLMSEGGREIRKIFKM